MDKQESLNSKTQVAAGKEEIAVVAEQGRLVQLPNPAGVIDDDGRPSLLERFVSKLVDFFGGYHG